MKKSSRSSTPGKSASPRRARKEVAPPGEPLVLDVPAAEATLATEDFAVAAREEEAASSGRRIAPIEPDDEDNAQKLVEEGLQGYMHGSLKKPRKTT